MQVSCEANLRANSHRMNACSASKNGKALVYDKSLVRTTILRVESDTVAHDRVL